MKQFVITLHLFLVATLTCSAQYTLHGKIEYEKKTNVHALMQSNDDGDNSWFERMKSQIPKFNTTYFDLSFDTGKSIYKPGKEVENVKFWGGNGPASDNTVLTDFNSKTVKAIKNVYEQKFFVKDSMRVMEWRVKEEIRTIANFKCQKAVGKICDSVYVVAFYTEDIPVSGGPEMFGGLPGMILELAIPRLHTTWVADKIEMTAPKESDFAIAEKGKKVSEKELYDTMQSSLKDWGKWAARNIWWSVL